MVKMRKALMRILAIKNQSREKISQRCLPYLKIISTIIHPKLVSVVTKKRTKAKLSDYKLSRIFQARQILSPLHVIDLTMLNMCFDFFTRQQRTATNIRYQGMRQEFGSAGAVLYKRELQASKSEGAKGEVRVHSLILQVS